MPSGFPREQVAAVAAPTTLELDPAEVDLFARQLADILAYADEVQQVDTTGVAPTSHVASGLGSNRADDVAPSLDAADALANAPDARRADAGSGFFFRVPRVIE